MAPKAALSSGAEMPMIGLGTWKSKPGQVEEAVACALGCGYRHIDCAQVYGNESEVGAGMKAAGVKREDVFITSKLWNTFHRPEHVKPALEKTLADLGVHYLDLYLMHWPVSLTYDGSNLFPKDAEGNVAYDDVSPLETYKAMEQLVRDGKVKAIGVSNFNEKQLQTILDHASIKPVMNQIEVHPYLNQEDLVAFCAKNGVKVTAYSPLGSPDRPWAREEEPALLQHDAIAKIAAKYDKTPAQVLIRYPLQRGIIVIPKSVTPSRIKSNFDVFDFELDQDDMAVLHSLNIPFRYCVPKIEVNGRLVPRDMRHPHYPFTNDADYLENQ